MDIPVMVSDIGIADLAMAPFMPMDDEYSHHSHSSGSHNNSHSHNSKLSSSRGTTTTGSSSSSNSNGISHISSSHNHSHGHGHGHHGYNHLMLSNHNNHSSNSSTHSNSNNHSSNSNSSVNNNNNNNSTKKRGEGTSCHHCKKRTPLKNMVRCTNDGTFKGIGRKRKRPCVKKYCLHCIKTFYAPQYLVDNDTGKFVCPSCQDECRCAACRRRAMKAKLNADGTKLRAMQANVACNPILESKTGPEAIKIEEDQVNTLLEILESRPDVQDIIRKGMSLDFADENAKILYIAHLIDQALSRPDILALYYAHTTGKSTLRSGNEDGELFDDDIINDDNSNSNSNNNNNSNSGNNEDSMLHNSMNINMNMMANGLPSEVVDNNHLNIHNNNNSNNNHHHHTHNHSHSHTNHSHNHNNNFNSNSNGQNHGNGNSHINNNNSNGGGPTSNLATPPHFFPVVPMQFPSILSGTVDNSTEHHIKEKSETDKLQGTMFVGGPSLSMKTEKDL